jgi:hypothetical protein
MAVSDTIAALAGAVIGGVAAVSGSWLQARAASRADARRYKNEEERHRQEIAEESDQQRRALTRRYPFQLQDSVESLRRRIENWVSRGGQGATRSDPGYWDVTTLYALGRALAAERILALEGAYADLSRDLTTFLTQHTVDGIIAEVLSQQFFFYNRLALAEATLEREPDGYRLLIFSEFRRRYEDPSWGLQSALPSAVQSLSNFTNPVMIQMAEALEILAARLETETHVPRRHDRRSS